MVENITITSSRNPRVVNARKLLQRKHRQRQGRFLVEGGQLLWMAADGGFIIDEVFISGGWEPHSPKGLLLSNLVHQGAQIIQVAPSILHSLSTRKGGEPLIGVVQHLALSLREIKLRDTALILVLDRLQDCGNVGTLIRTADAAGATAVILLEPCADAYDPRAVRSSMGSIFNLPVVKIHDPGELSAWTEKNKLDMVGADAHRGTLWGGEVLQGSTVLCLGNEASGLSEDVDKLVKARVQLPIYGKADSLNVAVAGGVLMYLWRKEQIGTIE
jgi:TrmH family RNA methyltransferase